MDSKLKQRLIGALVLIIAAVVFLPMLLTGQDETVSVEVEVPEQPEMSSEPIAPAAPIELLAPEPVMEIPQPEEIPLPVADSVTEAPAAVTPPEPTAAAEPVTPPATAAPAPEPAPAPAPATTQGDWVIQLGSFSAAANADGFKQTLLEQGYNAYTVTANAGGKDVTRVFVGPLLDRESANRLRDELGRRHDAKGFVVAYDAASGKR
ncbi:MAG: SPOR domain-containing protein [Halopseudomonas sp.]